MPNQIVIDGQIVQPFPGVSVRDESPAGSAESEGEPRRTMRRELGRRWRRVFSPRSSSAARESNSATQPETESSADSQSQEASEQGSDAAFRSVMLSRPSLMDAPIPSATSIEGSFE